MKTGDVGNTLTYTMKDHDGTVVDLTATTSATLRWKVGAAVVAEKVMTFIAPRTGGKVCYKTIINDLSTAGVYDMEIKLVWPTGEIFYSVNSLREKVDPVLL